MDKKLEKIKSMVNEKGIFHIFAIDHRDVFVKCLEDNVGHLNKLRSIKID